MGISFTIDQQKVIDTRHKNILVSAAAGSGKTAVLVERIVQLVCNKENGADIDELLVVTFTKAAAAEMRERIHKRIADMLEDNPEDEHIRKQYSLVHRAMITTIDSFCQNVLRNHFHDIGIDPDFRVMDEGERELMRRDVLTELLEEKYASEDEAFMKASIFFAPTNNTDSEFEESILKLQEYSESFAWPDKFLCERRSDHKDTYLKISGKTDLLGKYFFKFLKGLIEGFSLEYIKLLKLCDEPGGPLAYRETLVTEADSLMEGAKATSVEEVGSALNRYKDSLPSRLPSCKKGTVDDLLKEKVSKKRKKIKDSIIKILDDYFTPGLKQAAELSDECAEYMDTLISVTCEFRNRFFEKKMEEHVVDFGDLEHLALNILVDDEGNPTKVAEEYRNHFKEIMVDEYQDSNLVQDVILDAIASKEEGRFDRFMVGDVKQSIYGFRQARPGLFLEKYNEYPGKDGCERIDLSKNFRSRSEVLSSVNDVFEKIMHQNTGGIEYDESARLYVGAEYPEGDGDEFKTQLVLFDKKSLSPDNESDEEGEDGADEGFGAGTDDGEFTGDASGDSSNEEAESIVLAHLVKELLKGRVTERKKDDEGKEVSFLRPASYRDIVILHRSPARMADSLSRVFEKEGIPIYVSQGGGYFSVPEVMQVMQLLRVINNPLKEIALYGSLVSPFGGLTPDEVGRIRAKHNDLSLWEAVKLEVPAFAEKIDRYRKISTYRTVRELLQIIYDDHDYLEYVSALPAGAKRKANVEMLLSYASAYEKTSYFGLYHFVRYIDQLEKYTEDKTSEADVLGESADVVRFMSIHKSKGLEFPITILAGMGKRFNTMDMKAKLVHDNELGLGYIYVDLERRIRSKTLRHELIAQKLTEDSVSEELRLLYVAMTRAKEKLVMVGKCKNAEKTLLACYEESEESLNYGDFISAKSYLDLILPVVNKCPNISLRTIGYDDLDIIEAQEQIGFAEKIEDLKLSDEKADKAELEIIKKSLSYEYPHKGLKNLYTKTTVSELKMAAMVGEDEAAAELFESRENEVYIPEFRKGEKKISGTVRGNAYHRVMEVMDFDRTLGRLLGGRPASYEEFKDRLKAKENPGEDLLTVVKDFLLEEEREMRITPEYKEAVNPKKIVEFLRSELSYRMWMSAAFGKLFREQPFVLSLPASRVNPEFPEEESVLIQGIIDAYFEEDDRIILLDYKTDSIEEKEGFVNRYKAQLDYYMEAIEKLTGKKVSERFLYSFHLGCEIKC